MSRIGNSYYHPVNGNVVQGYEGFSWPAFFFGIIWMGYKELWVHLFICLVLIIITAGFAAPVIWLVYAFKGNDFHSESLLKKGYLTHEQWKRKSEREESSSVTTPSARLVHAPLPAAAAAPSAKPEATDVIGKLRELAELKERGVLTEDEFLAQKAKLLSS